MTAAAPQKKPKKSSKKKTERSKKPAPSTLPGLLSLLFVLLVLSALAGIKTESGPPLFVTGEIATRNVQARQSFLVEDITATRDKRKSVAHSQPQVYDLTSGAYTAIERGVHDIFATIASSTPDTLEDVRWQVGEDLNTEISGFTLSRWKREDFQNLILGRVLPWLREYLADGVVRDSAAMTSISQGILIRDMNREVEVLRMDPGTIPDIRRMRSDLSKYLKTKLKKPLATRKAAWALVGPLSTPSLKPNRKQTDIRRQEASKAVRPVFFHVKQGEIIVRKGERVSHEQQVKLQAMFSNTPRTFTMHRALGIFVLCALLGFGLVLCQNSGLCPRLESRDLALISVVIALFGGLAKGLALMGGVLAPGTEILTRETISYSMPLAGAAGVLALLFPYSVCLFVTLLLSFLCALILDGGLMLFSFYLIGGIVQMFVVKRAETRQELMTSVFPLLAALLLAWAGVATLNWQGLETAATGILYVLAGGGVSFILLQALAPILELLFGYSSRFRMMELMNLEQPLLQELMVAAPGTYHHSLILSTLVEAGARAIGANALLAKVAALYHDAGKLSKPQYFIENQMGGENKHKKLSPSMSALILTSHVKLGVEMAKKHKLGKEITDLIQQHHGTMLISYFYHKAKEQAEAKGEDPPREENFCYPGPKPQSREAALIMLADAIEASSRTLVDPTPSRIKGHIERIIKKIFTDGQLDESTLTLRDLHELSEVFHRILTGIFHKRIEYPNADKPREKEKEEEPRAEHPEPAPIPLPDAPRNGNGKTGHNPENDMTGQSCHEQDDDSAALKFAKKRSSK